MGTKPCPLITHDSAVLPAPMTAHGQQGQDLQHSSVQMKAKLINSSLTFSVLCTTYATQRDKVSYHPGMVIPKENSVGIPAF